MEYIKSSFQIYDIPVVSVPVETTLSTMKNLRLRVHFCESVPTTYTSIQNLVAT